MAAEFQDIDLAIRDDDHAAFEIAVDRHRRELQVHCYRMVGSLQDAEDMVQETLLRSWDKRSTYEGRATGTILMLGRARRAGRRHRAPPALS